MIATMCIELTWLNGKISSMGKQHCPRPHAGCNGLLQGAQAPTQPHPHIFRFCSLGIVSITSTLAPLSASPQLAKVALINSIVPRPNSYASQISRKLTNAWTELWLKYRFSSSRRLGCRNHVRPTNLHGFKNQQIHQPDRNAEVLSPGRHPMLRACHLHHLYPTTRRGP